MNKTKIKNYTSTVSAENTAARIEKALSAAGALSISKRYENGTPTGIDFQIGTAFGLLSFRLPIKTDEAYMVLANERKRYMTQPQRKQLREQAVRTAWKLAQDWVEVQLSLVAMKQVEFVQVFFPYAVRGDGQTLFDVAKAAGYIALLPPPAQPKPPAPSDWEVVEGAH